MSTSILCDIYIKPDYVWVNIVYDVHEAISVVFK